MATDRGNCRAETWASIELGRNRVGQRLTTNDRRLVRSLRLRNSLVNRLAAGEAFTGTVPMSYSLFAQLPAEQHCMGFHLAGEIEESQIAVFYLYSGRINFGERILYALDGLLALGLAPCHVNDVHQQTAPEKDAM